MFLFMKINFTAIIFTLFKGLHSFIDFKYNMLHGFQLVGLRATCCRGKMLHEFVLHAPKIISTHGETCRCDMSPLRFLACVHIVILSLIHVPATRPCYMPFQCEQTLNFVAASCRCDMSLRLDLTWADTFTVRVARVKNNQYTGVDVSPRHTLEKATSNTFS